MNPIVRHSRFSNRIYDKFFNEEKTEYIKKYYKVFSDKKIAKEIGVHPDIVFGYRLDVLKLTKRRMKRNNMDFRLSKRDLQDELAALITYGYSGIMKESVNYRIEFLKSKLIDYEPTTRD